MKILITAGGGRIEYEDSGGGKLYSYDMNRHIFFHPVHLRGAFQAPVITESHYLPSL